jgi:hypothetical protein
MNKNMRVWLLPAILIVVGIAAALWATSTFWFPSYRFEPRPPPPYDIRGDIELFYTVKTVISTINVTLIVFLLLTYVSIYRKTRSEFTIGLMIFSAVFLLNTLASSPFVMWAFGFRPYGLGPFAMLPDLFTFAALTVLLYLTTKY